MHKLLITRKRIVLYYLLKFGRFENSEGLVSLRDSTAEAIARNLGLSSTHVSTALKELLHEGLVERRKLHVSGEKKKKYVYRVTDEGIKAGKDFETKIAKKRFFYTDHGEEGSATIPELAEKTGLKVLDILLSARDDKLYLDKARSSAPLLIAMPRYFRQPLYGREKELKTLCEFENSDTKVCIIHGLEGMGKTSILRRAIASYRKRCFMFEIRKHYSTTIEMFFQELFRFMVEARIVERIPDVWDIEKLRSDLLTRTRKLKIIIAIDNFQDAEESLKTFLMELVETIISFDEGLKLIIASSEKVNLNPLSLAQGKVVLIELEPLKYPDVAKMLMDKGFSQEAAKAVYSLTYGIPALVEIATPGELEKTELTRDFLVKQILGRLSETERAVIEAGSLFNMPFDPEAIFFVIEKEEIDYDLLDILHDRLLLKKEVIGRYTVNEFLSVAISDTLLEQKKRKYHLRIGKYYERTGRRETLTIGLYHIVSSANLDEIEKFIERNKYLLLNSHSLPVIKKTIEDLLATLRTTNTVSQFIMLFYAEVLETMGLWKKAEAIYERLSAHPLACLRLAALLVRGNAPLQKTREIIEKMRKLCQINPTREFLAEYHYIEGLHAEQQNNLGEAVEHYKTTIEFCRSSHFPIVETYAWVGLARVFLFSGKISEAMDALQKAETLMLITDGSIERALLYLAIAGAYRIMGENGKDVEAYKEALRHAIESGERRLIAAAYLGLSSSFIGCGDYNTAKEYFLKAIETRTEMRDWHMELTIESQRLYFAENREEVVATIKQLEDLLAEPVDLSFATRLTRWCLDTLKWKYGNEIPSEAQTLLAFLEKQKNKNGEKGEKFS